MVRRPFSTGATMVTPVGEQRQKAMYDAYSKLSLEEFKTYCVDLIQNARKPNPDLIRKIPTMKDKDQVVMSTSNFIMKGHGFGVI